MSQVTLITTLFFSIPKADPGLPSRRLYDLKVTEAQSGVKSRSPGGQTGLGLSLDSACSCCGTLGKSHHLSDPWFAGKHRDLTTFWNLLQTAWPAPHRADAGEMRAALLTVSLEVLGTLSCTQSPPIAPSHSAGTTGCHPSSLAQAGSWGLSVLHSWDVPCSLLLPPVSGPAFGIRSYFSSQHRIPHLRCCHRHAPHPRKEIMTATEAQSRALSTSPRAPCELTCETYTAALPGSHC